MDIAKDWQLAVDYYNIEIKNMIALEGPDSAYERCLSTAFNPTGSPTAANCVNIFRDPTNGNASNIDLQFSNQGRALVEGVDLQLNWNKMMKSGRLNLNSVMNVNFKSETQDRSNLATRDWAGTTGCGLQIQCQGYDYRIFTTVSYFKGAWGVSLRHQYWPSILPAACGANSQLSVTAGCAVAVRQGGGVQTSYQLFALSGSYQFKDRYTIRVGIENLLDEEPPLVGYNPTRPRSRLPLPTRVSASARRWVRPTTRWVAGRSSASRWISNDRRLCSDTQRRAKARRFFLCGRCACRWTREAKVLMLGRGRRRRAPRRGRTVNNIRNHRYVIAIAVAVAGLGPACAQESGKVMIDVADCIKLGAPEARLACYESRVAAVFGERAAQAAAARPTTSVPAVAAPRTPEPAPVAAPAPQTPSEPRTVSAAPAPAPTATAPLQSRGDRQSRREADERAAADAAANDIVSRVKELHETVPNAWQITLENGQVWRQTVSKHYELRPGAQVRIYSTRWGSASRLSADTINGYIQVERVR